MSWVLAAVLVLGAEDPLAVLAWSPVDWPVAAEGRWEGWDPQGAEPPRQAARAALGRALAAVAQRDYPAALGAWFALLEAEPEYPPALYQAGVVYFRLRRYSDAAIAFERYLRIAPGRVGDTRALGHCHYSLGRYAEAADHYERVLAEGETAGVQFGLALARLRLGEEQAARLSLERVIELDGAHAEAFTWLAQLHFDAGRLEEARAVLGEAQALDAFAPRPWFLRARLLVEFGEEVDGEAAHRRFQELERVAQEARTLEGKLLHRPRLASVHLRLVELHVRAGDLVRVRGALDRWRSVEPESVGPWVAALGAWEVLGRFGDARRTAEGLARIAGESAEAWGALARHYARTKERVLQVEAEGRWRRLRASQRDESGG